MPATASPPAATNSSGNVTLNLPFGDNFALRGVIFTDPRAAGLTTSSTIQSESA
jgi:hypothetical protein